MNFLFSLVILFIDQFFSKNSLRKKIGLLACGTAAAQFITVLILPLLTRIFSPIDFGVLASYTAFIAVVNTISGLRYEMAIPLAKNEDQAFLLLLLSVLLVILFSFITAIILAIVPENMLNIGNVKWLVPLGIFAIGVYQALSYWALRKKAYLELAKTKLSQGLGRAAAQIAAGIMGAGAPGLVVGEVVGQSAGILRLSSRDMLEFRKYSNLLKWKDLKKVAKAYCDFPLIASPASLLNSAGLQAPTLLIAAFYGPAVAGWYFAAHRIVAVPVQIIARAVGDAFFAEAPELSRKNPAMLTDVLSSISFKLLLGGSIPAFLILMTAPWILPWILGSEWKMSALFLQPLSVAFLFSLAFSHINFAIIGKNNYAFYWAALRLMATAGTVVASFWQDFSPQTCVIFLSASMAISYFLEYLLWKMGVKSFVALSKDSNNDHT